MKIKVIKKEGNKYLIALIYNLWEQIFLFKRSKFIFVEKYNQGSKTQYGELRFNATPDIIKTIKEYESGR